MNQSHSQPLIPQTKTCGWAALHVHMPCACWPRDNVAETFMQTIICHRGLIIRAKRAKERHVNRLISQNLHCHRQTRESQGPPMAITDA